MPLSAGSRLQSGTGTAGTAALGVNSATVTLPNPTTAGSTVIVAMFLGPSGGVNIPDGWSLDQSNALKACLFRRPQPDGGESSWVFLCGTNQAWAWYAEELAGLDLVSPLDQSAFATGNTGSLTVDSGTTAVTSSADVAALAVFGGNRAVSAGLTWPAARSYSAGFTEVAFAGNGTGDSIGDVFLAAAEFYPGVTGTLDTVLTQDVSGGGSVTNLSQFGLVVAHDPAASQPDGAVVLVPGA